MLNISEGHFEKGGEGARKMVYQTTEVGMEGTEIRKRNDGYWRRFCFRPGTEGKEGSNGLGLQLGKGVKREN